MPEAVAEAGAATTGTRVMDESAALHDAIEAAGLPEAAPTRWSMAYRVRFYMEMNAREAMHVIELRTTPQGHPAYRRVCQRMHRLIAEGRPPGDRRGDDASPITRRSSWSAWKPSAPPSAAAPAAVTPARASLRGAGRFTDNWSIDQSKIGGR